MRMIIKLPCSLSFQGSSIKQLADAGLSPKSNLWRSVLINLLKNSLTSHLNLNTVASAKLSELLNYLYGISASNSMTMSLV